MPPCNYTATFISCKTKALKLLANIYANATRTRLIRGVCAAVLFAVTVAAIVVLSQAPEKKLAIFAPKATYSAAIIDRDNVEYVGLIDILEPLGKIEARGDKNWKLEFTPFGADRSVELQFSNGKRKAKIRGSEVELPANFLLSGGRGYLPLASLPNLLPRILDLTVELHAAGHRLFVGNTAIKMNAEVRKSPSRLVLSFPRPVSPFIATEGTNTRIVFSRDPVVSAGPDAINFSDPLIASSRFTEANGTAEYLVHATSPLLATFGDGGRSITIAAAPPQTATTSVPAPQTPPAITPILPAPQAAVPVAANAPPRFLVVIDAGHGGEERGAALTETLAEKNVTLALARRIHRELEILGMPAMLVRNSDTTLTLDQRAVSANTSRATAYVSVHASTLGSGLRVYTALLPPAPPAKRLAFLPWNAAQAPFLDQSSVVAGSVAAECNNRKIPVRALAASLRPLNSIAASAIGVEIAPPPESTVDDISSEKYQQSIAVAVAAGIAAVRPRLEGAR